MIGLDVIATLVFFAAVSILLIIYRKDIEFNYGFIMKRWNRGIHHIDRFVARYRKLLYYAGFVSIGVGAIAGIVGIGFMSYCAVTLSRCFGFVLPSVGGVSYPGPVVSIPFWYWIVSIFVIIACHESAHAIFARLEKVPVKSYGVMLILALPIGAFVDPDDKKIERLKSIAKMKIFSAGSFANFLTAGLVILLVMATGFATNNLIQSSGVRFESVINGTPAQSAGLHGVIQQVNVDRISSIQSLAVELSKLKPNQTISIATSTGQFQLTTASNPQNASVAFIGISNPRNAYTYKLSSAPVPSFVIDSLNVWDNLLLWIFILSIGIGIVNMLPIWPLDGGLMFQEVWNRLFGKNAKLVGRIVTVLMIGLIVFNLIGVWALRTLA